MTQSFTKQEKLVFAGLVVCCVGLASFISNFQFVPKAATEVVESLVNYKMGKATEEISAYTLEGREIERTVIKPESEEGFIAKAARKITEIVKGKDKDNKKKDSKAKASSQAATAKKSAGHFEFAKPQSKPVNSPESAAAKTNPATKAAQPAQNNYYAPAAVASTQTTEPTAQQPTQEPKKVKKSLEQIRSEFMASPSKEAMMTLVSSYKKNEVNAADFYQLQSELLDSQNDALIGHALYALRLTPSVESFSLMAQYQAAAKPTYQTYIEEALLSYNQASQINVLQSVIRSGDKVIVMKALDVISTGINSIKGGQISQLVDSRNRRETTFANFNLQNYAVLLPTLTQVLASTQDSELTASLEQLRTLIKDNSTQVASNP